MSKRKQWTDESRKETIKEIEALTATGMTVADALKQNKITSGMYYKWKRDFLAEPAPKVQYHSGKVVRSTYKAKIVKPTHFTGLVFGPAAEVAAFLKLMGVA